MTGQAVTRMMVDGRRLHMQHGPMDIIAEAFGAEDEIAKAYKQGSDFFQTVLEVLVSDLDDLKKSIDPNQVPEFKGIALAMWRAAHLFSENRYVTPMAAVAGAVADGVKHAMLNGRHLEKLYVNNGGDISLHLSGQATFSSAIIEDQDRPCVNAKLIVRAEDNISGVATSGWRGRSFSRGIADAVTVLAKTAAKADVAATLIANDVFISSPSVQQEPANSLRDDTDLGNLPVTVNVGELSPFEISTALQNGLDTAQIFLNMGLIDGAYLSLQGQRKTVSINKTIWERDAA
ncbi:MAG: UPF0280 family protein [Sneathiella sp.]